MAGLIFTIAMEFEVLCSNCDTSYEASVTKLMRNPAVLHCPECNERAADAALETFRDAAEAFFEQLAELGQIMTFTMEIDSAHLPPPFGDPEDADEDDDEEEFEEAADSTGDETFQDDVNYDD